MHACKRIRLTTDTHAYIEQHARPTPESDATPDYASEIDAIPPDDSDPESESGNFNSDSLTDLSDPEPEDAPQPLDLERLCQLHFELNGN